MEFAPEIGYEAVNLGFRCAMPVDNSHKTLINLLPPVEPKFRAPAPGPLRLGFLAGKFTTSDDFDYFGSDEITALFDGA